MIKEINLTTRSRTSMLDITAEVKKVVDESGVKNGVCHIYVPHTTAAVTINENADPSVKKDIIRELEKIVPFDDDYEHLEGNSAAHIKSSMVGVSEAIIVEEGGLRLGTWQGVCFCEFDGPRKRRVLVKVIPDPPEI
jgi:secondary thiamine-phosphate synthase enzyme